MYIYCIPLLMTLFIIPSQSIFGKSFAKPLAKAFRETSIIIDYAIHLFFTYDRQNNGIFAKRNCTYFMSDVVGNLSG